MLQTEIDGLTRSSRCFTLEELERQRKAKDKEVIDVIKGVEMNKPISEEDADTTLDQRPNKYVRKRPHIQQSLIHKVFINQNFITFVSCSFCTTKI
jgi:hypothetical protein